MNLAQTFLPLVTLALFTLGASAAPKTFDFNDPRGLGAKQVDFAFESQRLGQVKGSVNLLSGTVSFDPANPAATKGKIVLATSSLQVSEKVLMKMLPRPEWMNVEKFPEITFEAKSLKNIRTMQDKRETQAIVTGTLTVRGVAKEVTVPVVFKYLENTPSPNGDVLNMQGEFTIKRTDFGINLGKEEKDISDAIRISFTIPAFTLPK